MTDSQSREPGFESPLLRFRSLGIFVLSMTPQSTQLYKLVPGIDSGGNASDWSLRVIAAWLECFQEKPRTLVSE